MSVCKHVINENHTKSINIYKVFGIISGCIFINDTMRRNRASCDALRDGEFGLPQNRKRVDPLSPFFPSDKHPCTHAGMFIPGCHELKIFSGSSHFELADDIARRLGTRVGEVTLDKFGDGEVKVQVRESVRGKDVYIVQSLSYPVNDNIIELLLMVSTMRRASAKRVTIVIPYYAYKHHRRGSPTSTSMDSRFLHSTAADIGKMLEVMGVDRVIGVDLQRHGQGQEACFFSAMVPVETLDTVRAGVEYFATQVRLRGPVVIVAPTSECLKKARKFERDLKAWLPDLPTRVASFVLDVSSSNKIDEEVAVLMGDLKGAEVIFVDDIIDTCGTLEKLTKIVRNKGARKVYCFAAHGLFNEGGEQKINEIDINEVVIMNTIPPVDKVRGYGESKKIKRISVAPMLAELIQAEHFKAHSYIDIQNIKDYYRDADEEKKASEN